MREDETTRCPHCNTNWPWHDAKGHQVSEALWVEPRPRTFEGQRLWAMLRHLPIDDAEIRDYGQRICQIEFEAAHQLSAPRETPTPDVKSLTLPLRKADLSGMPNNNCAGFEDGWTAALDSVDARLDTLAHVPQEARDA